MIKNVFLFSLFTLALMLGGCTKEAPLAPETDAANFESPLSKPMVWHATCLLDFSKTMVDSGKVWVDDQGVLHIRDQVYENTQITGDFIGIDLRNIFNADINLATGAGRSWGRNRSRVTWSARNLTGVWTGEYKNEIVGGQMRGTSSYFGGGDFAGLYARCTQEETGPGSLVLNMKWTIHERTERRAPDLTLK